MNPELCKSCLFTQFIVFVCVYSIHIESQHVAIRNTTCNCVFVQHVTKESFCSYLVMCIFFKDWCSSEAKEQRTWKSILDPNKHASEYATMALINDKYQSFTTDCIYLALSNAVLNIDVRHFLYGCYNQSVIRICTLQLAD